MIDLADPEAIEAVAARLDARAEEVREGRRGFDAKVAGVAWSSDGADDYRGRCEEMSRAIQRNVTDLEQAADDLRAHAEAVRRRLAWMEDMVDQLRRQAEAAWEAGRDTVEEGVDAARDLTEATFEWGEDQVESAWKKVLSW
ncbi:WXG100 family type VII secretion target [Nocardioides bruguierae]|uniref:WXG100 family type VII secretion target n=1 Tax=Nocardioides bruguierae TaxID=2945102 RepID=A0A9X2D900_9ACTN|nr:WXG100 family type VII secretion target [Nocardioides bruguierae]MCM0621259.1 WXG100 family type VII secretion target [Nocardioides bruguierae]